MLLGIIILFLSLIAISQSYFMPKFFKLPPLSPYMSIASENEKPPQPRVIKPSKGTSKSSHSIEKFLMMYTCKLCSGRNAQMVLILYIINTIYNYSVNLSFLDKT